MKQPFIQQVHIEKIVYPGKALGRGADGIATFIEGALPGESVEAVITRSKQTFREGIVAKVLQASPLRIAPRCPSFGSCGGCSFQHTGYENQLQIKSACVKELLYATKAPIDAIIPSPEVWNYRNKMEFSFFEDKGDVSLGLHRKGEFDRYFPVPPCCIADSDFIPIIDEIVSFARASGLPVYNKHTQAGFFRHLVLRKAKRKGEILVNLVTNRKDGVTDEFFKPLEKRLGGVVDSFLWTINSQRSDAVNVDELRPLWGKGTIDEQLHINGRVFSFAISPFSFFQTNTFGTEKLFETIIKLFDGRPGDQVLDLYCGTGTIGIVLSPYVGSVVGVEQVSSSVEDAKRNALLNSVGNITFIAASVEKWLKVDAPQSINALVLDPPRCGLSGSVIDYIIRSRPSKIIYVSCNPSTLARDLSLITEKGSYETQCIVPLDMFPHTYHVETVASLISK